ncbi:MAG: hypothetical protein V6S10_02635 [Candidatus Methanoglobus sp.]
MKRSWGCSRAEGSPAEEGKGVKPSLAPEAPEFSRGVAHLPSHKKCNADDE